jgi:peptidoglycan LD-endopeptidase LytH
LEHQLHDLTFYTLYGHVDRKSLETLRIGKKIATGESFCQLGEHEENGNWYPHLHFQVMASMLGFEGDFPGVAAPSEMDFWLELCPNPELLVNLH